MPLGSHPPTAGKISLAYHLFYNALYARIPSSWGADSYLQPDSDLAKRVYHVKCRSRDPRFRPIHITNTGLSREIILGIEHVNPPITVSVLSQIDIDLMILPCSIMADIVLVSQLLW
jgi:hypothetical protein